MTIINMRQILASLVRKTQEQKIRWDLDSDRGASHMKPLLERRETSVFVSSFVAHFPYAIIRITFVETGRGLEYVQFVVENVEGGVIGTWTVANEASGDWQKAGELYGLISKQSSKALNRLAEEIESSDQTEVGDAGPLDDLVAQFFKKVAGTWNLTYYRGNKGYHESCRIDEQGHMFVAGKGEDQPFFYLDDVFYDPEGNNVSFAKVDARESRRGRIRQVEVLEIDPNGQWMKGYAQDDKHRLEYVRVR